MAGPVLAVEPDAPDSLISRADAVGFEVQQRLAEPFRADRGDAELEKSERGALVEFYAEHGPIWVQASGLTERARAVVAEIERADDFGLDPGDYELPARPVRNGEIPADRLADIELKLSRAVLAYARHARGGRIEPSRISGYFDPTLTFEAPLDVMQALAGAGDVADYLQGLHPRHPQFEALRKQLAEMRGPRDEGARVEVPDGPILRLGDSHEHVSILRQRLDVQPGADVDANRLFDEDVDTAVRAFQSARGLSVDGIVGPATRRAFSGKPADRTKTILVNMERWRWLPRALGDFHVRVNIPEYALRIVDGGETIHTERVVVGKPSNQTPVFSDMMEHLEFNPYWHIPDSIKVDQILPSLLRETDRGGFFWGASTRTPGIFQRQNLRARYNGRYVDPGSVDWHRVDIRRFHIYQMPGPNNAMGDVKFMFPNRHNVYMHDTPQRNLFERSSRAFSYGCMRIRNPMRFAEILLSRDRGWGMDTIQRVVANGDTRVVRLERHVPVHMMYFTAWIGDDGQTRYFGDVYGHDRRLEAALGL